MTGPRLGPRKAPAISRSARVAAAAAALVASALLVALVFSGWARWVSFLFPEDDSPVPVLVPRPGQP